MNADPRLFEEYEELLTRAGSLSQQFLGLAKRFGEPNSGTRRS